MIRPSSPVTARTWDRLARHLEGGLILPFDPAYATAKQLELGQFDVVNPQAVAYCVSPADVSTAVRFAQDTSLPVAVRSGGHSYGGYSTTPGLVVDVITTLAPHGLVISEGGCPTVAAGGFLQGGGFGFLTRSLGMTCDVVTSAEVVLADGTTVTASPREHSDLFWAIRGGGGGNFGIVTTYTVTPHVGDRLSMTAIFFPYDRAADVLHGFTQWLTDAPRSIGGGAYVVDEEPAPHAGPTLTIMLVSSVDSATVLAAETDRLLSVTGTPAGRQEATLTYRDLMMIVFRCGDLSAQECHRSGKSLLGKLPRPAFGLERTRLADTPYTASQWSEVMSAFDADQTPGHMRYLDVHMFGGAVNDLGRTDTAYVHRDSLFSVNYRVTIADPQFVTTASRAAAQAWVDNGFAVIDAYSNGETYQNWMDPALRDWQLSYYAENYPRLEQVKARYDPARFFSFPQGIGAR
jgi:FAD/FMN-containing dehydrogenase